MRERTKNDLGTPAVVLNALRPLGPIRLDPCSNPWSIVDAEVRLDGSPGRCGLAADWHRLAGPQLVYVNPPYGTGHMPRWAEKIVLEAGRGCEVVALVKGDHSTQWWQALRRPARAIGYWNGRIAFLGGAFGCGEFASSLVYYGRRARLFARALEDHADVRLMP